MTYPAPNFLPSRREFLCGFAAAAALGVSARAGELDRMEFAKELKPLPEFEFVTADDKPGRIVDFKGKGVLINFWATWCAPCVKEMPSLDRLQAALPKDQFLVLPISLDGPSKAKVAPFYRERKLDHLGIYFDKGRKAMSVLDVSLLPTSILVDRGGREVGRLEGDADWDAPEAIALIKAAM